MATISPGSMSRTNEAPTMSKAQVSEATTQPPSRRPNDSGRTPCGSRAAYNVWPSVTMKQKAPLTRGRSSRAASRSVLPSVTRSASSAETTAVSEDEPWPFTPVGEMSFFSIASFCSSR